MRKLTENLQELSDHIAGTENKVAAAEQGSKEKIEVSIKHSKEAAKARQESFKNNIRQTNAAMASHWEELQDDYNQKIQQIKNKMETEKEARELKKAMKRADEAESCAETSIMFVDLAIDEAEIAILEAIDARAYAEMLE